MESSSAVEQTSTPVAAKQDFNKKKDNKKFFKKNKPAAEGEAAEGATTEGGKKEAPKKKNHNPNEPYIFIIKNAENDLCRIHESALPQFLGLNLKNQEKRRDGASYYEVKIRSETRTGEITFHGKDEAAFFKTSLPHPNTKVNINKKAGEKREREEKAAEAGAEEAAVDPATEGEATTAEAESARYTTIADMLASTSSRPYYNNHLSFTHTEGAEATTSLMGKLTGAIAEVNQKINPKGLKKVLKDVPGFLSCWFLKATGPATTQFRVVFNTENDLMNAKEVLDQFEADQGIRVAIKLSDNIAAKYQKFLVEKAGGGAESGDVVAVRTDNADYE